MNEQKIDPENTFPCKECGKIYGDQTGMLIHFLQLHRSVNVVVALEQFVCSVCDSKFMSYEEFQNHLEQHKLVYLYCKHCNFKCTCESDLEAHINKHTSEKNIEDIVECMEVEPDLPDLNINEMASYTCSDCGESFHRYMNLKWHLLTHGEKKYYSCPECDYKTIYHYNFKLHFKQHSGSTPYVCSECDFKTIDNKEFLEHKNKHAKNYKKRNLRKFRKPNDSPEPLATSSYVSLSYFTASCKQSIKTKPDEPKNTNNKIISHNINQKRKSCKIADKNHNINVEKLKHKPQYVNFKGNKIIDKKSKNLLRTNKSSTINNNDIVENSNSEPQSADLNDKAIVAEKAKNHPLFNEINDSGISVEISENELAADESHKNQMIMDSYENESQTNNVNNSNISSIENSENKSQSHHINDDTKNVENSKDQLQSTKTITDKHITEIKKNKKFHNTAKRETTRSKLKLGRKRNGQFAKMEQDKNHKDLGSTIDMKETNLRKCVNLKRKSALPYTCSYCSAGCASLEQIKMHKEMHNITNKY